MPLFASTWLRYEGKLSNNYSYKEFSTYQSFFDFVARGKNKSGKVLIGKQKDIERLDMSGATKHNGAYWRDRFKPGWNNAVGHKFTIKICWFGDPNEPREIEWAVLIYQVKGKANAVYTPLLKVKRFNAFRRYFPDVFPKNLQLAEENREFNNRFNFGGYNMGEEEGDDDDLEEDISKSLVSRRD